MAEVTERATPGQLVSRLREWSLNTEVGETKFGDGYRAAQADARSIIVNHVHSDRFPPKETVSKLDVQQEDALYDAIRPAGPDKLEPMSILARVSKLVEEMLDEATCGLRQVHAEVLKFADQLIRSTKPDVRYLGGELLRLLGEENVRPLTEDEVDQMMSEGEPVEVQTDPIKFSVRLDHFDIIHPHAMQTSVYVRIPGVGETNYLMPAGHFEFYEDKEWPEVLNSVIEYHANSMVVTDSNTERNRKAIAAWLRDQDNWDELQAQWEHHQAVNHPLAQQLIRERDELKAKLKTCQASLYQCDAMIRRFEETADIWESSNDVPTRAAGAFLRRLLTEPVQTDTSEPGPLALPRNLVEDLHGLLGKLLEREQTDEG